MSTIDLRFGLLCQLTFWPPREPPPDQVDDVALQRADAPIRARFGDRALIHVGAVNVLCPLWVEASDVEGPVFCRWNLVTDDRVSQVADRRVELATIAELVELVWAPHPAAPMLPHDDVHRDTARDVVADIAQRNPGSDPDFWRHAFFRQFALHIEV